MGLRPASARSRGETVAAGPITPLPGGRRTTDQVIRPNHFPSNSLCEFTVRRSSVRTHRTQVDNSIFTTAANPPPHWAAPIQTPMTHIRTPTTEETKEMFVRIGEFEVKANSLAALRDRY